jgi:tetratricopeptide (TPR) repeat protein
VIRSVLVVLVVLVGAAVAVAGPESAQRKKAPDKFAKAASESFVAALAADQKGDLRTALGHYQKAFAISPHPSTIYNIADLQRRLGKLTDAVRSYETYLAISPEAADRRTVETLIDKLARTPGSVFIMSSRPSDPKSIDLSTAYVLIQGKIVVKPGAKLVQAVDAGDTPGIELTLAPGRWELDVVTPLTYGNTTCHVSPGERSLCSVSAPPRIDGAVIVSGTNRNTLIAIDRKNRVGDTLMYSRFVRKPGRTKLHVRDGPYECAALVLDVPAGGDVLYVFLAEREPNRVDRCRTHEITKQRLHFDP